MVLWFECKTWVSRMLFPSSNTLCLDRHSFLSKLMFLSLWKRSDFCLQLEFMTCLLRSKCLESVITVAFERSDKEIREGEGHFIAIFPSLDKRREREREKWSPEVVFNNPLLFFIISVSPLDLLPVVRLQSKVPLRVNDYSQEAGHWRKRRSYITEKRGSCSSREERLWVSCSSSHGVWRGRGEEWTEGWDWRGPFLSWLHSYSYVMSCLPEHTSHNFPRVVEERQGEKRCTQRLPPSLLTSRRKMLKCFMRTSSSSTELKDRSKRERNESSTEQKSPASKTCN